MKKSSLEKSVKRHIISIYKNLIEQITLQLKKKNKKDIVVNQHPKFYQLFEENKNEKRKI